MQKLGSMLSSIRRTIIYYSAQKHQNLVAVVNFVILSSQQEGNPKFNVFFKVILNFRNPTAAIFLILKTRVEKKEWLLAPAVVSLVKLAAVLFTL